MALDYIYGGVEEYPFCHFAAVYALKLVLISKAPILTHGKKSSLTRVYRTKIACKLCGKPLNMNESRKLCICTLN